MKKKEAEPAPSTIKETTKIMLEVKNDLYYSIKGKADKDTQNSPGKKKKTIAIKMCEMLEAENTRQDKAKKK